MFVTVIPLLHFTVNYFYELSICKFFVKAYFGEEISLGNLNFSVAIAFVVQVAAGLQFSLLVMITFPQKIFKDSQYGIPLEKCDLKGALSGLRQFLTTESPLKMMEKIFYFT